jgi:enoyl-CoA hydratase
VDTPDDALVRVSVADGVATVVLDRPERRNALSVALLRRLAAALHQVEADDGVGAVVLTGAGPAFCAGLDLAELGADGGVLLAGRQRTGQRDPAPDLPAPVPSPHKPLIGAINGPAVTGGLELALHCDWLVAGTSACFADTHARVGVQPLWGLTVLLPQAVGLRRARQMSATGAFIDAATALAWGLVNEVVPDDQLLAVAQRQAAEAAACDRLALATLFETYHRGSLLAPGDALALEARTGLAWRDRQVTPEGIEARRRALVAGNRARLTRPPEPSSPRASRSARPGPG